MLKSFTLFLSLAATLLSINSFSQVGPPPRNLQFDSLTLVATWEPPRSIVLDEHFEGTVFPPQNWQDTTKGIGWFATTNGSSPSLNIPPHTTYAVVNNNLAGAGNNGCCDYLITPEMDLTHATGYTLIFNSFFRGLDAETASVEISTDGGITWIEILEVLPHFAWAKLTVDLGYISGSGGAQHVKIAFKANDNGNAGSTGWAVDDVVVMSDAMEVDYYGIFWDGTEVGQTSDTTATFPPGLFPYGFPSDLCVSAMYYPGYSECAYAYFPSYYLAPPTNLEATANVSATSAVAMLSWAPPATGDFAITGSIPRTNQLNPNCEYSPQVASYTGTRNSNALWDELFVYQSNGIAQAGVETDGNFIYTSVWSDNVFYKYDLSGNLVESFTIPGVSEVRDMAYDGQYFYGSAADYVLFKIDLANKTLISVINTEVTDGIRHIAYDPNLDSGNGGFWCGDWAHLCSIRMNGTLIAHINSFNLVMCYGSAYDPVNNKLWFHDQGGIGVNLWEFDIATLSFTGVMYEPASLTGFEPYTGIAGGLAFTDKVVPGKWVLLGLVQQPITLVYGLEIENAYPATSGELLSYNIYRNNQFLVNVPKTTNVYWDQNLDQGTYNYQVSALYDLTNVGFPGQTGESLLDGPAYVDIMFCSCFPFLEDWTTGQFDTNLWTIGPNWIMDGTGGNPLPAAKFQSQPQLINYSSKLLSFGHYTTGINTSTPYCIWLDFDYFLDDISASGTEKLTVEVSDGDTWIPVGELTNNGDMGWTKEHINITSIARNKFFRVRFNANGINSTSVNYWMVDNIHLYPEYSFTSPANFSANNTGNTQQNEIQLEWDIPLTDYLVEVFEDDSTYENSVGINPGYTGGLGNKLNAGKGTLRAAEIGWQTNGSTSQNPVFVDIFDVNHNLLGSSDAFVPVPGSWQLVAMPDIDLDGDFYTMVRFERHPGTTAVLGMDSTTNSGRANAGWFYDGSGWSQMNAFGFDECVFSIRAVVKKEVDCENNVIEKNISGKFPSLNHSNMGVTKSASETSGSLAYEVYRREYQVPVPGQDSLLTDWQKIATLSSNSYLDQNLHFKCYQYYVEAFYDEGSSVPSNTDEACFLAGMDELKSFGIKLYPNPVHDFLTIETNGQIERISVFNATGIKISQIYACAGQSFSLDVSKFSPGIYNLNFTTSKGETIRRKFVKL